MEFLGKIFQSIQTYFKYLDHAIIEICFYYFSPIPLLILLRKIALANRKVRIIWAPAKPGRKPLDQEVVDLIIELKKLNPTWGGQRISDELKKVGINVSKKTVLKYLRLGGMLNPSPSSRVTWTEFLSNHKFKIGIDFTSIISLAGHQYFIFVILNLETRELIHINVTTYPFANWVTQQFRDAFYDFDELPSLCICDNDTIFGPWFETMMIDFFDIQIHRTPYKMPWKNGRVERFHLSLKNEAFSNVIPITQSQIRKIGNEYKDYYNNYRCHQGLGGKVPNEGENSSSEGLIFEKLKHLGGQITTLESCQVTAA